MLLVQIPSLKQFKILIHRLAVQNIDPSANVDADTQTKLVKIKTVESESTIRDAIAKAGYPPA